MAKKMRTINNPLDRQTRNDINYNFSALEENVAAVENSQSSNSEQVTRIENDITKLKQKDKELEDLITDNREVIESMDLDLIKLQGDTTEAQGLEAKRQGDKAEQQGNFAETKGNAAEEQGVIAETKGNKAEQLGNFAKEMGDYAKEKAEYAAEKTSEIEQAHTDLSQIKVDAVDATQSANTQAEYAKEQGDYAKLVGDEVADKLEQVDTALQHTIAQGIDAETKGNVAKEQGDYAQSVIDSYKHDGDWQGSVEYKKNQEVLFNGSTYRALEDNKGTQPTDKSVWQLIAQRGVDGEGAVASVNKKQPDTEGNVQLSKSDIGLSNVDNTKQATKAEFDTHVKDTVKHITAQERTDWNAKETTTGSQAKATKALTDSKAYTDTKISEIPEVDTSHLETKSDAQAKLTEAKQYTDTKTTNMETTTGSQTKATKALNDSKAYTNAEIAKISQKDYLGGLDVILMLNTNSESISFKVTPRIVNPLGLDILNKIQHIHFNFPMIAKNKAFNIQIPFAFRTVSSLDIDYSINAARLGFTVLKNHNKYSETVIISEHLSNDLEIKKTFKEFFAQLDEEMGNESDTGTSNLDAVVEFKDKTIQTFNVNAHTLRRR